MSWVCCARCCRDMIAGGYGSDAGEEREADTRFDRVDAPESRYGAEPGEARAAFRALAARK